MSLQLAWDNLVAYSMQIGLLVGLAAFVPALLRLRLPGAKLTYWYILLAACLLLPAVRPWRQAVVAGDVEISTRVIATTPVHSPASKPIPYTAIALLLLAGGAAGRLGWLGLGLWRLGRYRRHSQPLGTRDGCETYLSDDISSPVTFGWGRPVVLLPSCFPELERPMQEAILCHELLHVERSDWLFTLVEEMIRAVFWFHPAIWWLLGEIQLAREQAVDREVVKRTKAREEYVDALLTIAGATPQLDLAPAPLFLRKRHLKQRVVSILKEVRMSKTRLISGLAAGVGFLAGACWFVTATFPLAAAPQVVNDATGITVEVSGAALLHRSPVQYPVTARKKGVQGTVTVEAVLDSAGNVSEARVMSGPQELRAAAQQSVLQWHFKPDAAGATRLVNIIFQTPPEQSEPINGGSTSVAVLSSAPPPPALAARRDAAISTLNGRILKTITVQGLSDQMRSELLSRLPVREGDALSVESLQQTMAAIKAFDEHLRITMVASSATEQTLTITAPSYPPELPRQNVEPKPGAPQQIKIGGGVQQAKLIQQPHPIYPPDAKEQRIQGAVKLQAVIAADGTMKQLDVISGHPLLVPAALDAVKLWRYQPTLLNGDPVEVLTQIDVNFTLSQ